MPLSSVAISKIRMSERTELAKLLSAVSNLAEIFNIDPFGFLQLAMVYLFFFLQHILEEIQVPIYLTQLIIRFIRSVEI